MLMNRQTRGVPIGATSSAILVEIFLLYKERNLKNVTRMIRYVDDLLVLIDKTVIFQDVVDELKRMYHPLDLKLEERGPSLRYLAMLLRADNDQIT